MWFKKRGLSRHDETHMTVDMYLVEARREVRKGGVKRKAIKVATCIGAGAGMVFLGMLMVWLLSLKAASNLGLLF
jgi:hypothetical protein